jgi:hypothetical protein
VDGETSDDTISDVSGRLRKVSATRWEVEAGEPGWVVVPEEYSAGWQVEGRSGQPTVAGTIAFELSGEPATITYAPWRYLFPTTVASLVILALLVAAGLWEHRKEVLGSLARQARAISGRP